MTLHIGLFVSCVCPSLSSIICLSSVHVFMIQAVGHSTSHVQTRLPTPSLRHPPHYTVRTSHTHRHQPLPSCSAPASCHPPLPANPRACVPSHQPQATTYNRSECHYCKCVPRNRASPLYCRLLPAHRCHSLWNTNSRPTAPVRRLPGVFGWPPYGAALHPSCTLANNQYSGFPVLSWKSARVSPL